jgi:hypothetical protein
MHRKSLTAVISILAMLVLSSTAVCGVVRPRLDAAKIKAGLRTTTVEEKGFVDRVVAKVNQGRVPYWLVYSTFKWARIQPRYKFQYFKWALIMRASWLKIRL